MRRGELSFFLCSLPLLSPFLSFLISLSLSLSLSLSHLGQRVLLHTRILRLLHRRNNLLLQCAVDDAHAHGGRRHLERLHRVRVRDALEVYAVDREDLWE